MGKYPCCDKVGLKKGPWSPEEDKKLLTYIQLHGHEKWHALPSKAGLRRCGKSCRLRWANYLKPDIKRGNFSLQEDETIIQLHALLGNRWSVIAAQLPKRTDNEIKNYWNTQLKKRLTKMGINPVTHKPMHHALIGTSNISHMAQWETARLEAEARQAKMMAKAAAAQPPRPPCLDVLQVLAWANPSKDVSMMVCNENSSVTCIESSGELALGKLNNNCYINNCDQNEVNRSIDNCCPIDSTYVDDSLRFTRFMQS